MSKVRTFIAIEISDALRQKIAGVQEKLKKEKERVSWTKPGNIHVTLKFLGDVEENEINAIVEAVERAVGSFNSFILSVKNIGAFPNLRRPRVFWVGIENPPVQLTQIFEKIEDELNQIGFPKETRKFSPHLTIGRVRSPISDGFIEKFKKETFEGGKVRVEEIVVMKSDLKPTGAVYTPLKKVKLKVN